MEKVIRRGVFETNSSSSHSLTVGPEGVRNLSLIANALHEGVLTVEIDDHFGWEWKRLYRPENKIAYLLSQVAAEDLGNFRDDDRDTQRLRRRSDEADMLLEAIEAHTGLDVVVRVTTSYPGVDHDSAGVGRELLNDREKLLDFIFSHEAFVQLGNDNTKPPALCETDLGEMREMYAGHYLDKMPRGLKVEFEGQSYGKAVKAYINRDKETLEAEGYFSGLYGIQGHLKGFSVSKAVVTLYKPRQFNSIRIRNGRVSDGSEDWLEPDLLKEMAVDKLHHFIDDLHERGATGDVRVSRDLDLEIRVEQGEGDQYRVPEPMIKLTGVMSSANIDRLKAGFAEMIEDFEERKRARSEAPAP